ncbi:MAG: hypothetical protein A2Y10_05925 [Planctomycetes bacterium GWF2_41_51]|nr:MAG: hypothetical protein A2Y10_05925 [Planctomycetes bacterium GWF2_41_51]
MKKEKFIGIDLGTTFSEVTHINDAGIVEVIPNLDGDLKTPSVVSWANGKPVVGKAALPDLSLRPDIVMQFGKRQMGKVGENGIPIPLLKSPAGEDITAIYFSAEIISYLKKSAEQYLGCEIKYVVITNPAYFDEIARSHTIAAAKKAGFTKIKLLDEPVSAALYYGLEKGNKEIIVVIDFGGGTLDITVLNIDASITKATITDGDAELGGGNYDESILQFKCGQAKASGFEISAEKDLATFYSNLDKARLAKEMLARREEVMLVAEAEGKRVAIKLTRKMFLDICRSVDERFIGCCKRVFEKLQEKNVQISKVILVGGSSRLFHVPEMVKDVFGIEPSKDTDPDFAIAKGAAIWAQVCFGDSDTAIKIGEHIYLASDIKIQSVAAHAICVAARKTHKNDDKEYNYVIVPENTQLPHEFERKFAPLYFGQNSVSVKIVQGKDGQLSEESTLLREFSVPIRPSDTDSDRINVKGRYTEEGLLEITVCDALLNKPVNVTFNYNPGSAENNQI